MSQQVRLRFLQFLTQTKDKRLLDQLCGMTVGCMSLNPALQGLLQASCIPYTIKIMQMNLSCTCTERNQRQMSSLTSKRSSCKTSISMISVQCNGCYTSYPIHQFLHPQQLTRCASKIQSESSNFNQLLLQDMQVGLPHKHCSVAIPDGQNLRQ